MDPDSISGFHTENQPTSSTTPRITYFRAFIAVEITNTERFIPIIDELRRTGAQLKLVNLNNIHITLKFLGNTEETAVRDITNIIRKSVLDVVPFSIKLQRMGAFPSMDRINVVWVSIQDADRLALIADDLNDGMERFGFSREKRGFSPHLTLARVSSQRNIDSVQRVIKENATTDFGELMVRNIKLKKSILTPKGPIYTTISEVQLSSNNSK